MHSPDSVRHTAGSVKGNCRLIECPDTQLHVFAAILFSHIFAGGYAAGYYSYKWAEVLDADAFSVFQANGIYDKASADAFRENILMMGGTVHPAELYRRFRGQDATIDALLKRDGINQ